MNAFEIWEFIQSYVCYKKYLLKVYLADHVYQNNLGKNTLGKIKNKNQTGPKSYMYSLKSMSHNTSLPDFKCSIQMCTALSKPNKWKGDLLR